MKIVVIENELIKASCFFIKFPRASNLFSLLFDSDYKNNMMNFFLPHCDGLKWLMIVENCMSLKISSRSSTSYKSRSKNLKQEKLWLCFFPSF